MSYEFQLSVANNDGNKWALDPINFIDREDSFTSGLVGFYKLIIPKLFQEDTNFREIAGFHTSAQAWVKSIVSQRWQFNKMKKAT